MANSPVQVVGQSPEPATSPGITATNLPQLINNGVPANARTVYGGIIGLLLLLLGSGTTIYTTKEDTRELLDRHMQEGHPQIKQLEDKVREMETNWKKVADSQERMGKHIYSQALKLDYTITLLRWANNGKTGPEPEYPKEIQILQYEVMK